MHNGSRNFAFLCLSGVLALGMAGCTSGDSESVAPATTAGAATTTTQASTTTVPPIGTPFPTDAVLAVTGISEVVGEGTLTVTVAEEDGQVEMSADGTVRGAKCLYCMATLELGPGAVAADTLFVDDTSQAAPGAVVASEDSHFEFHNDSEGTWAEVSVDLIGPTLPDGATLFIVAGEQGAVLEKEGAGFRLVEGEAWLVTDRSLIEP